MSDKIKKSGDKKLSRVDYELNHVKIHDAYLNLIKKLARKPTQQEVADFCGLDVNTVTKHVKTLKFRPTKHPLRALTDDIILSVFNSASTGNSSSQKFWFQLMEGWAETTQLTGKDGKPLYPADEYRRKLVEKLKKTIDGEPGN